MLDEARKLPGLCRDDPLNFLPRPARLRIDRAYLEQQAIREAALAKILARAGADYSEWGPAERELLSAARIEAAYTILSAYVKEFSLIGKSGTELERIVREQLEATAYSLELPQAEQNAVWLRLLLIPIGGSDSSKVVEISPAQAPQSNTTADGFATAQQREAAIVAYTKAKNCSRKELAQRSRVAYQDLNAWKLYGAQGLAKSGTSGKAIRIENELRSFLS